MAYQFSIVLIPERNTFPAKQLPLDGKILGGMHRAKIGVELSLLNLSCWN
jgi:hypothetical protein